jgi:hypothetical protein
MLKRLLVAALLCVLSAGAMAQQAVRVQTCGQAGSAPPNVSPLFVDANGNLCANGPSNPVGPAMAPFTATVTDQALTLTLPGRFRLENPQYQIGTTTFNTTPLQINYAGGNACTAPTATLSPGQIDDWFVISGTTQPHVCVPTGTLQIEAQQ